MTSGRLRHSSIALPSKWTDIKASMTYIDIKDLMNTKNKNCVSDIRLLLTYCASRNVMMIVTYDLNLRIHIYMYIYVCINIYIYIYITVHSMLSTDTWQLFYLIYRSYVIQLEWRHNERNGVSNDRRLVRLLNRLLKRRLKIASKLRVTGLCEGKTPVTGEFPAKRVSNARNVFIWWRHHAKLNYPLGIKCFLDMFYVSVLWNFYH